MYHDDTLFPCSITSMGWGLRCGEKTGERCHNQGRHLDLQPFAPPTVQDLSTWPFFHILEQISLDRDVTGLVLWERHGVAETPPRMERDRP